MLSQEVCIPSVAGGLNEQSWRGQLKEFESRLAASKAQWKLVVRRCTVSWNP